MAKVNIKRSTLVTDTKLGSNKNSKKKQNNRKINSTSEIYQTKTNLKRGKLASNWNSYVETYNSVGNNKKIADKFPKTLTTTNNAKTEDNVAKMGQPIPLSTGRCIAIDCEMVGINESGKDHMLARVSLIDENGTVVYDTFVKPTQRVVDYRTAVSGVRPVNLVSGKDFQTVQAEVHDILHGKVLVGHAVRNDLKVLYLTHNKRYIRDTSKFKKFREETNGMTPSLKFLSSRFLGIQIQTGEHSSIEDARAAMQLYMKFRNSWEAEISFKKFKH